MANAIELKHVTKEYDVGEERVKALNDVSLKIGEGEFVAVVGASGSGKSTLLHIMGALDKPTRGSVKINGKSADLMSSDELAELRAGTVGFVFQFFNLIPRLTALENVSVPAIFSRKSGDARKLLEDIGLVHRAWHMPSQLSGGERQRVAIARAMINDPKIILADEPTGNLDSVTGKNVMDIFKSLNEKGKTIVLITHDRAVAKAARRIVTIKDGMLK
ncbi:MAG: ABC transporter ATP-binding protein [Candidatus Aenigmarchaeota archaeon]|nr:ABC transporter ATP-binding protein [Candidatus Aenigmarchaeota archaeon]